MSYYVSKISISFNAKSDEEASKKTQKILEAIKLEKDCTPYVDQISRFVNNSDPQSRYQKLDQNIIKNLNLKK